MRTTVEPEVAVQAMPRKHARQDPRLEAPRRFEERRTMSIFVDRRHQSR
jgi:hypothetical protein